ncbi:spermatid-specific manchette-related protein 1 [Sorex araneus]|uniref:spermatid-specific manchette-related protein 1 n=1 Tax=Sorex araneus TaxID=42254 RepID=UPI00243369EB|nr:spermatid-specific manchette-related protein 1 [Sorex araneus]
MFLFSRKTKTPISTYTDSYRVPTSIKEVYKDPSLRVWEANKSVTRGLTQRRQQPECSNTALQRMVNCTVQDYPYKDSFTGHPYFPEKYWISPLAANRCSPNYQWEDQYKPWRMEPSYYTSWNNRYLTPLPQLPKIPGMETSGGMLEECPCRPERFSPCGLDLQYSLRPCASENQVMANMMHSLSRYQPLPQISPRYGCLDPLRGRMPYQGYESSCSGRHYCLRGMDYLVTEDPCSETSRQSLRPQQPIVRSISPYDHRPGMQCAVLTPPPSFFPCPNLKWETSHFEKTGGAEKDNYVIHPEFTSEIYPDGC